MNTDLNYTSELTDQEGDYYQNNQKDKSSTLVSPIAQAAKEFLDRGLAPLPLAAASKMPHIKRWTDYRADLARLDQDFRPTVNIGLILGQASGSLVTVDCDWPEAGILAEQFLPSSWTFGRIGNDGDLMIRHRLFRSVACKSLTFDAPVSGGEKSNRRIIEILADGRQVMVPPSRHPSGHRVEWIIRPGEVDLAEVSAETLSRQVALLAGAALLCRRWPSFDGSRHQVAAALAGACRYAGWDPETTENLLKVIFTLGGDDEVPDRLRVVADTLDRAAEGTWVTGLPTLARLIGPTLVNSIAQWWNLGTVTRRNVHSFGDLTTTAIPLPSTSGHIISPSPVTGESWWPELIPFDSDTEVKPILDNPYPVDDLGPVLGPAVEALVRRQQVPVTLAAQSCLAAAVSAVQMHFNVVADGRIVPPSLFQVLVAVPGERKTTTDAEAMWTVDEWMRKALTNYSAQLADWLEKKSSKTKDVDLGPKPRRPTLLLNNGTVEGIRKSLDEHWPAITLINSDAAAWLGGYSMRDGRDSATAATLSNLWSGASDHSVKASQESPQFLTNRRLSLSLMLQPIVATTLLANKNLLGQGFLSRCLVAFPTSTIGTRLYRRRTTDPAWERFNTTLRTLLDRTPPVDLLTGELQPIALPLDELALEAWIAIHDRLEVSLIGDYQDIAEVANKGADQVLRLAGIQAALEGCQYVNRDQIERADRLLCWYLDQWLSLTNRLRALDPDVAEPRRLLKWLQSRASTTKGSRTFTLREITSSGPRLVRGKSEHARELLAELLRRGYVRTMVVGKYELRPEDL
jgi:hypothetical protein